MKYLWLAFTVAMMLLSTMDIFRSEWHFVGIDVAMSLGCLAHYIEKRSKR